MPIAILDPQDRIRMLRCELAVALANNDRAVAYYEILRNQLREDRSKRLQNAIAKAQAESEVTDSAFKPLWNKIKKIPVTPMEEAVGDACIPGKIYLVDTSDNLTYPPRGRKFMGSKRSFFQDKIQIGFLYRGTDRAGVWFYGQIRDL